MKKYKLDVAVLCHGLPLYGGMLDKNESLGGSETAAIQAAESLAKQGHYVYLFCNTEKSHSHNKVMYIPMGWVGDQNTGQFPKGMFDFIRSNPLDVIICQRQPSFFRFATESKVNFLWQHDLATKNGPSNFHPTLWNIDRVLVLSDFMKEQYQKVHGGPDELYHLTRNGIDINLIDSASTPTERDRFKLTYTARPERGLDVLLQRVFPKILEKEPRAKLYLSRYQDVNTLPLYDVLRQLREQFGDKIVDMGNLGKKQLYEHYKSCRAYVYPSYHEETHHITSLEAGACGLPLIGPWKGAIPQTAKDLGFSLVRENGTLGKPGDKLDKGFTELSDAFVDKVVDETLKIMHDDNYFNKISSKASANARKYTWDEVTEDWMDLAHKLIEKRTDNPRRLFTHFLEHSDVVYAKKYAKEVGDPKLTESVDRYIKNFVPFMNVDDKKLQKQLLADFYESRSGGDNANWQTALFAFQEIRLQVMLGYINDHKDEINTVLDMGCAHGGYATAISNQFPHIKVVGVDVSPSLIRAANDLKAGEINGDRVAKYHDNLEFIVGDEDGFDSKLVPDRKFDLCLASDVLEHVPYSEEFASKLERFCKKDGHMLFTVPYGRNERNEFLNKGVPPVHVRAFDKHDIRDIFGKRKNFANTIFSPLKELELDQSFHGWFMVTYQKDDKKLGQIDWERKKFLQGPRETISACIIAHNEEHIIGRMLQSVQKFADQIIVIDNGPSSDNTVGAALKYTNEVYAGTSPFYCYTHKMNHDATQILPGTCEIAGFETPRNEAAEYVWGDWQLMVDCDEVLLQAESLRKFLRPNAYPGYAIKQHHLATEPLGALKTDLPVRVFRTNVGLRCEGIVHEHFSYPGNMGIGELATVAAPVHLMHDGYATEEIRRKRFLRNLKLLECDRLKYPDRTLGIFLYDIRDQLHLARYKWEESGRVVTQEVAMHCEHIIKTFRERFLEDNMMLSWDALKYYSDAMALMNQGLSFTFSVNAGFSSTEPGEMITFRAKDSDEANIILSKRLKAVSANLEGEYVR